MTTLISDLERHGFLTTTAHLIARGHSPRTIGRAVANGRLLRVCRGWVATADASQLAVIAVANRGKLAGPTALFSRDTWDGADSRIHVHRPANSHGPARALLTPIAAFRPPKFPRSGLRTHWAAERFHDEGEPPWRVSVIDALALTARHAASDQFLACLDSVLHEGTLSRAGLPVLFSHLPERMRELLGEIDPTAGSGLETLSRVRLKPIVRTIETQVRIPGLAASGGDGWVDLLIDGWLVIELDGDKWHDPKADRKRDQLLVRLGYRSHRFGYENVVFGWAEVEATILELLRYPPRGVR